MSYRVLRAAAALAKEAEQGTLQVSAGSGGGAHLVQPRQHGALKAGRRAGRVPVVAGRQVVVLRTVAAVPLRHLMIGSSSGQVYSSCLQMCLAAPKHQLNRVFVV